MKNIKPKKQKMRKRKVKNDGLNKISISLMELIKELQELTRQAQAEKEKRQKLEEEYAPFQPEFISNVVKDLKNRMKSAAQKGEQKIWTCLFDWKHKVYPENDEAFVEKIEKWAKSEGLTTVRFSPPKRSDLGVTISW